MKSIFLNKTTSVLIDTFDWQTSPQGHKFRLSGLRKNSQIPSKFINGMMRWHWIYRFFYEDDKEFYIEIDYYDKFVSMVK